MYSTNAWRVYLHFCLLSTLCNFYECSQAISKLFELPTNCSQRVYPEEDQAGPTPLSAWMAAYREAKDKGLIPDLGPSVMSNQELSYADYSTEELNSPEKVCSWTISKCVVDEDIVAAPKGMMGISFDDGPAPATTLLLPFLLKHKQKATHFMIGSRILDNPEVLKQAAKVNRDHIAVHTWSHPYMTSLTDEQILGEIGWTMQIIRDKVGLIPAFWRPPYGDIDNRVRAIASHVFNLTTVIWSDDVNDWCLTDKSYPHSECGRGSGPQNSHDLLSDLDRITNHTERPQERDSGIIILEHEADERPIEAFMQKYPSYKQIGWDPRPIPDLFG
ncbi:family 4 carbohydrate esterase [Melampsora larici-populina 98AG31]|uniref:chitin deacetylase n=1 Tax=Melampsora larici-populina (strain 98AG31 / pathotype 3-4-7) TaxID=747676 RepID=F4RPD1_MELLP|nr:family 4 carbohydrate esterase [Melampsora larici-populina 98AG31]EGG05796.1 family 4 carbohydrate esterase [Melampsora larici-populina 98AG31]